MPEHERRGPSGFLQPRRIPASEKMIVQNQRRSIQLTMSQSNRLTDSQRVRYLCVRVAGFLDERKVFVTLP